MAITNILYAPSAFKINGTFLEELVSGYHTLSADDRLSIEKQLNVSDISVRDGSIFTGSKYPAREIEVEYFIEGDWQTRQARYTQLMGVLDTEDAVIVFNGEPDKYIHGYFTVSGDVETFQASGTGKFKIYCPDPFKYSVEEFTQTAVSDEISVTYNGTYKAYPTIIAEFPETLDADGDNTDTSECGYIGYTSQRGAILAFGDEDEVDFGDIDYPATVPVNREFKSITDWTQNGSAVISGTQTGTIGVNTTDKYIYPSAYGTNASGYHGPSLSHIITGETEPIGKNFNFNWKQKFTVTKTQYGGFEVMLWNNDNGTRKLIGGVKVLKTKKNKTTCEIYFYCGNTSSSVKSFTGVGVGKIGSCSMQKYEEKVTFNVGGKSFTASNGSIKDLIANEITFHFMQNKAQTVPTLNCVYNCKLQRTSFVAAGDIPNTFKAGDVLTVDTSDAEVLLNDIPAAYLGALGNDWENFCLVKGTNAVQCHYSDFTTTPPNFTMKYRERYI